MGLRERLNEAKALLDRDRDLWVLKPDGWCCKALCEHEGEMVRHSCTEHDHFAREEVEMLFGPLTLADSITGSTDADGRGP